MTMARQGLADDGRHMQVKTTTAMRVMACARLIGHMKMVFGNALELVCVATCK